MDKIIQVRDDIGDRLVHLTKDNGLEGNAFGSFMKILSERCIRGGAGFIRDKIPCVCFSEAPIQKISLLLASKEKKVRYSPWGLMFEKKFIYLEGGRPVIYQPADDYSLLPESKKHLHVTFDLGAKDPIDFTWEREWRLRTDQLVFGPEQVTLIVPNRFAAEALRKHLDEREEATATIGPWHFIALADLGLPIDF